MVKKRNLVTALSIIIFILIIFFYFWLQKSGSYYEKSFFALDTLITIKIYDSHSRTEEDVNDIIDYLKRFEKIVNFYDSKSELSRLNQAISKGAALSGYPVSETLEKLLVLSLKMSRETRGKFDFTVGSLMKLWDFAHGGRLPDSREIDKVLQNVSYKKVTVSDGKVFAPPGVVIDLGGIAKGYAMDAAMKMLKAKGYHNFLINSVSSTVVSGSRKGEDFRVGIENPRGKGLIAIVRAKDGESISTSGDYQKFFEYKGKRYHHLIDPETGYPASELASVTVVSRNSAAENDALSTAIFVMGKEKGLQFAKTNNLKVIMITPEKKILIYPKGNWVEMVK